MDAIPTSPRNGLTLRAALITVLSALAPLAAYPQVKPVTVVNPASNPVQTRITNSVVPVEVRNADPIPVTASDSEGTRETFTKTIIVGTSPEETTRCNSLNPFTIPAGKRAVVQNFSGVGSASP